MRIALLSAVKRTSDGELRADQMLAGRSVLAWQIDQVLKHGCERIICLCNAASTNIIEQQRYVEGEGFGFHTVRSPLQISGLTREEHQLFIVLDGLVLNDETLTDVFADNQSHSPTILTLASDHPLTAAHPQDFERIDAERHWAGIAVIPGECAMALGDMPEDGDAVSLLLRLGLQARVPCKAVATGSLDRDQWLLASDNQVLEARGQSLLEANIPRAHWSGPSAVIATQLIRASAPKWLQSASEVAAGTSLTVMMIAVALAGFGFGIAGLATAFVGALISSFAPISVKLRSGIVPQAQGQLIPRYLSASIAILAAIVLMLADTQASSRLMQVAIPTLAIGLAWLAGRGDSGGISAFWRDTALHMAFLTACAGFGFLQEGLLVFALSALLQLVVRTRAKSDKAQS